MRLGQPARGQWAVSVEHFCPELCLVTGRWAVGRHGAADGRVGDFRCLRLSSGTTALPTDPVPIVAALVSESKAYGCSLPRQEPWGLPSLPKTRHSSEGLLAGTGGDGEPDQLWQGTLLALTATCLEGANNEDLASARWRR